MIPIPWEKFGNRRQHATITAGASGRIYYYQIPSCYVGFLTHLYCPYFADTHVVIRIDGSPVETLREQVGQMDNPFKYDPPYLVTRDLELIAHNDDPSDHVWEVKCDGEIYDEVVGRKEALAEKHR